MAKMIPSEPDDFNSSLGEELVFYALKENLPDDYTVFYSFWWNNRKQRGGVEWGEADFTVFHPKYGILVIEVKSGGISLDGNGRFWHEPSDNRPRTPMKKDPLEQASRTKYMIKDMLDIILPFGEQCWIEPVVWFPSVSNRELINDMPNTYHKENVLMDWALKNTRKAIENAYNFYSSESMTNISPGSVKLIERKLAPAFRAIPNLGSKSAEHEFYFMRLTNEQFGLLDYLDEQRKAVIQGSAGTGKTLLAVEKARRLSEYDKVLFLCFNSFLRDDLTNKNKDYENIEFCTLKYLATRETKNQISDDNGITAYLDRYDEIGNWNYKHIIVDEGQDFNDEHLELLEAITDINEGVFYIFYDKNQLVQRRELPSFVKNAECRLVLSRNCRNTHEIATTAGRPIDVKPVLWSKALNGDKPALHIVTERDILIDKLDHLVRKYSVEGIPPDQITILTAKTEEKSIISGLDKIARWSLVGSREENKILFTTARKFKGLESIAVIIIDVDADTFRSPEDRNLFYVGSSRAMSYLEIVCVLNNSMLNELGKTLSGEQAIKNAASKVASALKVRIVIDGISEGAEPPRKENEHVNDSVESKEVSDKDIDISKLKEDFHRDMINYHQERKRRGYSATIVDSEFQKGLSGYEIAIKLADGKPRSGFRNLSNLGLLDYSLEALVIHPKYSQLFPEELREVCRNLLDQYR